MATRVIDIIKHNNTLFGVNDFYEEIEFKPGNKFIYNGKKYRVGFQGNYFAHIPWWEYIYPIRKLVDIFVGKRDYDY